MIAGVQRNCDDEMPGRWHPTGARRGYGRAEVFVRDAAMIEGSRLRLRSGHRHLTIMLTSTSSSERCSTQGRADEH